MSDEEAVIEETPVEDAAPQDAGADQEGSAPQEESTAEFDWRETALSAFEDKEARASNAKFLKSYDSLSSLVKGAKALADKQRDGKTIDTLDEDATPEDQAKALEKLGFTLPEKLDDYAVAPPEDLKLDDESSEMLDRFKAFSHETKIPQEMAQKVSEWFWNEQAAANQKMVDLIEEQQDQSLSALKEEWSSKREFNENTEYANEAIKYAFGDKFQDMKDLQFEGGLRLGDHPEFVRAFAKVGRILGEDGTIETTVGADQAKSAEAKLDELMKLPKHEYKKPEIQRQVDELTSIVARRKAA